MKKNMKIFIYFILFIFLTVGSISIAKNEEIEIGEAVKIKANFYNASNSKGKGIILLHMLGRNKGDWKKFALYMKGRGYSCIAIDFRNKGNANEQMLLQDTDTALKYLKQNKCDKIFIVGASIGANIALNFADVNNDIKGIVMLSPGLNYRNVKTENTMKSYSGRPVLIAVSYEDQYSCQSAGILDKYAKGNHKLIVYKGAGHGTNMLLNNNKLKDDIYNFIKEIIK